MLKTYDGLLIFNAALSEEALEKAMARLRSEIARMEGGIVSSDVLGKRSFARPRKRMEGGIYVRLRFELPPLKMDALKKRCKLVEELFRMQVRTVDDRVESKLAQQSERRLAHAASVDNDEDTDASEA